MATQKRTHKVSQEQKEAVKDFTAKSGLPVPKEVLRDVEEVETSGVEVIESYFDKTTLTPGLDEEGYILGKMERYCEVPRDPNTGEALAEIRHVRQKQENVSRNMRNGFVPLKVKDGKLDKTGQDVFSGERNEYKVFVRPTEVKKQRDKIKQEAANEYAKRSSAKSVEKELRSKFHGLPVEAHEEIEGL